MTPLTQRDAATALSAALSHHRARRLDAAAALYAHVLRVEPRNFDALNNLGLIMKSGGRLGEAIELLRRAVAAAPLRVEGHSNLGNTLRLTESFDEAIEAYRRALALAPDDPEVHNNLGVAFKVLGRHDDAVAAYRRALALRPSYAAAQSNLGNALRAQGRSEDAIAALRRALDLDPDHPDARLNLARTLLDTDRVDDALDQCDRLLDRHTYDVDALALKGVCLAEAGRVDDRRALADHETDIRCAYVGPPPGFDGVAAFNGALTEYVLNHPTLEHNPPNHATINGWHSGDLIAGEDPSAVALEAMIREAVAAHMADLPADPSHPLTANRPRALSLRVWAIVLGDQGYQLPHIHPSAWLSGVYYVSVPDVVSDPAAENGGWIEFGRADTGRYCRARLTLQLVRPIPGLVITFPSYLPHRTIPFSAAEKRISIAFDVVKGH